MILDGEDHNTIMADRSGTLTAETIAWFHRWLSAGSATVPGP